MQQKYTRLLGNYQPMIQSADLGAKGVWYRLRVGPMSKKAEAQSLWQQPEACRLAQLPGSSAVTWVDAAMTDR